MPIQSDDGKDYVELDALNTGETPAAVRLHDGDRSFWVPKSLMEDWPDRGQSGTALIQEWFLIKEGLI